MERKRTCGDTAKALKEQVEIQTLAWYSYNTGVSVLSSKFSQSLL